MSRLAARTGWTGRITRAKEDPMALAKTLACGEEANTTNFNEECVTVMPAQAPVDNPFGEF